VGPAARFDARAQRWSQAMQLYRRSVEIYREVLLSRAQRGAAPPGLGPSASRATPALGPTETQALSAREREVASLIARGYTNQQIAQQLIVTRGTAANHVAHILSKLGLANRTQVAAYFVGGLNDQGLTAASPLVAKQAEVTRVHAGRDELAPRPSARRVS
jgi:DNA-binding NarL/FixJ family response regulator